MAPALGPTTALAMCAAAFVGWRAPSQPAQTAEPEVEEFASMDKLGDGEMHTVLSGIDVSGDFCEDAMLPACLAALELNFELYQYACTWTP